MLCDSLPVIGTESLLDFLPMLMSYEICHPRWFHIFLSLAVSDNCLVEKVYGSLIDEFYIFCIYEI